MPPVKYKYEPDPDHSVVPCISLKDGERGVITEVSLYRTGDYIRSDRPVRLPQKALDANILWGEAKDIPRTLEECTDQQLMVMGSPFESGGGTAYPIEELRQLRELEQRLRKKKSQYREQ